MYIAAYLRFRGMKHFFTFCFLLLLICRLDSQRASSVSLISVNDGLSQGMVFDILQSRAGFIWIATKDGLNFHDGVRFKVYSPDPFDPFAIGGSDIRSLYEDSFGRIWVGMTDKIDIYDPTSGKFFHLKKPADAGIYWRGPFITEVPKGTFWILDRGHIRKLNLAENILQNAAESGESVIDVPYQSISLPPSDMTSSEKVVARCRLYTQNQKLLIGTNQGIYQLDPTNGKIEKRQVVKGEIHNIIQDKTGRIMVRLIEKSYSKSSPPEVWTMVSWNENAGTGRIQSRMIYSKIFNFDHEGNFWIVRERNIEKYRPEKFLNNEAPEVQWPFDKSVMNHEDFKFQTFFFDRSGMLWAGTNGFGIFKINPKKATFNSYLPKTTQRMILEDPRGNLITLEDIKTQYPSSRFEHGVPNTSFTHGNFALGELSVAFDGQGNCWTYKHGEAKLYRTDVVTREKRAFPWQGLGLFFDPHGKLLSVSGAGLYQFDPSSEKQLFFPFRAAMAQETEFSQFFYKDKDSTIWIFGFEGLIRATSTGGKYQFQYFTNRPSDRSTLSSNIVMSVADDPLEPKKYLWIGTKGGGLNRLDKITGKFKQYKTDQGLPDNVIYGVLAENVSLTGGTSGNHIWLSSNKGLCRFHVREETCRNFTVADGLQDNEFNSSSYFKTSSGAMLFGGVKGLTVFHPDSLHFNENIPQTHIVGLRVNNIALDISGKSSFSFSYDQNLLTFDFAALEFTNPAQNQYRYQLKGVDKDWVFLGNKNSIQFANLAPGNYTFKVLGSNSDGAWSDQAAEVQFTIRPPWYGSWWAYGFYLIILGLGGRQYYRYRLSQKLEHQETLRLREMDAFKSRFFTNITHEFRTPLTVMLGVSDQLKKEEKDTNKRNKIDLIERNGENLLRLINQILDLTKLESKALELHYIQGDILKFIRYITESMHALVNAQNILLRVESSSSKIIMDFDAERIIQIMHNLLSNAIKFTPSGGKVTVTIDTEGAWLLVAIADSGAGIPEDALPHLFERFFQAKNQDQARAGGTGIGLSLTKELVKAMGGEISAESTLGEGSIFRIKLPITHHGKPEENLKGNHADLWKIREKTNNLVTVSKPSPRSVPASHPEDSLILVIEDNADVSAYLDLCLQGRYALDFAYNGTAGVEKAFEQIPDIIISDVMMPGKDGFEVVDILKNDERTSHIPIVLLTAKADVQSRLTGLRKGADHYLSKPFHQEELLVTLENLLEQRRKLQIKYQQKAFASVAEKVSEKNIEDDFLIKVREIVEANYMEENFGLAELCQKMGMSRSQLFRKMKALTDIGPSDLIRKHRLKKAKSLLESGSVNVAEATWKVGFKDPSYFSKMYQEEFGVSPSATRK